LLRSESKCIIRPSVKLYKTSADNTDIVIHNTPRYKHHADCGGRQIIFLIRFIESWLRTDTSPSWSSSKQIIHFLLLSSFFPSPMQLFKDFSASVCLGARCRILLNCSSEDRGEIRHPHSVCTHLSPVRPLWLFFQTTNHYCFIRQERRARIVPLALNPII